MDTLEAMARWHLHRVMQAVYLRKGYAEPPDHIRQQTVDLYWRDEMCNVLPTYNRYVRRLEP